MTPAAEAGPRADRRSTSPYGLGSATTGARHHSKRIRQDLATKSTDAKWGHFKPPRRGHCKLPLPPQWPAQESPQ
jgi:hypothetical protein